MINRIQSLHSQQSVSFTKMQDPKKYERNKSGAQEAVKFFLPKLINLMKWAPNELVLDYGCGAGSTGFNYILPEVKIFGSNMISVDVSRKMLEFAKEKYPHELIEYHVGDILDEFPFPIPIFDKIFAVHVFHFIRDLRRALLGFYKILKPAGQMDFTTLTANSWIFRSLKELSESEKWNPYMMDYPKYFPELLDFSSKQEIRQRVLDLLESSEFNVVHLDVILDRSYEFENIDTFLEIICSCNPCIDNIPKNLYQVFKDDIKKLVTGYAEIPVDSKGIDFRHDYIWGIVEKAVDVLV